MAERSEKARTFPTPLLIVGAIVVLILLVLFGRFCSTAATIDVRVNGTPLTLHGAKNMEVAVRESGLPINPGDLISLSGNLIKKSAGEPFSAVVNGTATSDPNFQLHNGDEITLNDGEDKVEEYDSVEESLPHSGKVTGLGAICKITPGVDGVSEIRTGRLSGETVKKVKTAATDTTAERYNPNVGEDKVIALTFDEGPSEKFTGEILDVLRENDAKATFFCTGSKVASSANLIKREREQGCQVCSNTYSLSWTAILSGKATSESVDAERIRNEVQQGQQAISDALDGEELSRCARIPVSTLTGDMTAAIDDLVDAEISWNVDTGDWVEYNSIQIYNVLIDAEPGDVILLHDGGGDRSATVQALDRALPELKEKGFSFITIDELREYPAI